MTTKLALFCSAIAAASLCAPAALAADAAAAATATSDANTASSAEVATIVVTARKREENLQSVPIAVTAQTGSQLEKANIRSPDDLSRIVPSLTITSSASSPSGAIATLRGQAPADVLLTLSQPVAFYEDSVNIPHPEGADVAFFDIDRVEVLNGPQGTLYGRNTTGGAINILTRGADHDGVHGFLSGEGGNFNDWKLSGAVNLPLLNDTLAVRVAYQHWNREGFGHSLVTGEKFGDDRDDDILRVSAKWDPDPRLSVTGKLEYVKADRHDGMFQNRELGGSLGTANGLGAGFLCGALGLPLSQPAVPGSCYTLDVEWALEGGPGGVLPSQQLARQNASGSLFTNDSEVSTYEHLEAWHGVVDGTYKVTDDIDLRSITGFHQFTDVRTFDLDALDVQENEVGIGSGGIAPAVGSDLRPVRPDQQSTQWTQEFDLTGVSFNKHLNWLGGVFYSDDQGDSDEQAAGLPGLSGTEANFYNPSVSNKSWAIYTQDDIKLNDMFSVTVGGRYTDEQVGQTKSVFNYALNPAVANRFACSQGPNKGGAFTSSDPCNFSQSLESRGWSYLFSFNAQVTKDILLYAKTSRGFRGGALQIRADAPAVNPEIAVDYEVGLKSEWFDHRLLVNLDSYETQYSNKQETQIIVDPVTHSAFTAIVNAANARIFGVEGQINAVPVDGLTLNATFDYLHGVYTNFPGALAPGGAPIPGGASGVEFSLPPWKVDVGGRYSHALGPGEIAIQADYSWTAAVPQTILTVDPLLNSALANEWYAPVGLMNGRVEYNMPDKGLSFALFATNLLNKHYQTAGLSGLPGFYTGQTQEPLMYGISIRKTFGGG